MTNPDEELRPPNPAFQIQLDEAREFEKQTCLPKGSATVAGNYGQTVRILFASSARRQIATLYMAAFGMETENNPGRTCPMPVNLSGKGTQCDRTLVECYRVLR
jgi:hypothetical protein